MACEADPIRILHVVPDLDGGGLQTGVVRLIQHLPADGFRHVVCCLHTAGRLAERLPDSTAVYELRAGWHDVGAALRLARLIHRCRPNVVHARNWSTWPDAVLASMLMRRRRVVFSLHGWDEAGAPSRWRAWACRRLARRTDHLCSVSSRAAELFAAEMGLDPRRFEIMPNGVDVDGFRPRFDREVVRAEMGLGRNELAVGWVGRLEPIKDLPNLFEAFSTLVQDQARPCRLVIVGDGALRDELQERARRLGIQNHVRWLGWRGDVHRVLPAFDVFALSSRREGMNNAVLEAMACGLPVVATDVGGTADMVRDGVDGRLVRPGDPMALARALHELTRHDEVRRRMGASACERARTTFSLEATIDRYAGFYRRAARQPVADPRPARLTAEPPPADVAPA